MTDWTRHPDDPHVWIYKDKYTLRLEGLTWYLYPSICDKGAYPIVHTGAHMTEADHADLLNRLAQLRNNPDAVIVPVGSEVQFTTTALDHIHTPQDYYHQPHFAVPRAWAEIVVNMHEAV